MLAMSGNKSDRTQAVTDTTLSCPFCSHPMVPGNAYVAPTFGGFLLFGLSYKHLYFASDTGITLAVRNGVSRSAHQCGKCGAIVMAPVSRSPV